MDLVYYNGEHSITFGEKNSWTDWHLIPLAKPVISPPVVNVKQVEIPGMNGVLDLTTVLTGYPTYSNRTGSISFLLAPGFEYWENAKAIIMNYLHGRSMNMRLADDPDHFYSGMFSVSDLKSDTRTNTITIDYDLYPFRHDLVASDEDWLWDPFNFETGVIRNWSQLTVDGELELVIDDCTEPSAVYITTDANMDLVHTYYTYNGEVRSRSYSFEAGETSSYGPTIKPGHNTLLFTGTGTIGVRFRGGSL